MKITPSRLMNIVLAIALLVSMLLLNVSMSTGEYDPWADINGDGIIDISDATPIGMGWLATGDPTRNVNVTNWPYSEPVCVWWETYLAYPDILTSSLFWEYRFGHLHILGITETLSPGASIAVEVWGLTWNTENTLAKSFPCYTRVLYGSHNFFNLTIPVPSASFLFKAYVMTPDSNCVISLSYYLTWA